MWNCAFCTLENPDSNSSCSACGNGHVVAKSQKATKKEPEEKKSYGAVEDELLLLLQQREQEIRSLRKKIAPLVFMKNRNLKTLLPEVCAYEGISIEGQPYAGRVLTVNGEFTVRGTPVDNLSSSHHSVQWFRINQHGSQILVATGTGYTCSVGDVGCFIGVSCSTLNGQVQDFLLTNKPIAIPPNIASQLEAMLASKSPIQIPVTRPKLAPTGKKSKWNLLLSKQKFKIQIDGKTQIKVIWGDNVSAIESATEPFDFIINLEGKAELFSTSSHDDRLMAVLCIQTFGAAAVLSGLGEINAEILSQVNTKHISSPRSSQKLIMGPASLILSARNATINAEIEPVFCDKLHLQNNSKLPLISSKAHSMEELGFLFKVCEAYSLDGSFTMEEASLMASLLTVGVTGPSVSAVSTALLSAVEAASVSTSVPKRSMRDLNASSNVPPTLSVSVKNPSDSGKDSAISVSNNSPASTPVIKQVSVNNTISPASISTAGVVEGAINLLEQWLISEEEKNKYLQWFHRLLEKSSKAELMLVDKAAVVEFLMVSGLSVEILENTISSVMALNPYIKGELVDPYVFSTAMHIVHRLRSGWIMPDKDTLKSILKSAVDLDNLSYLQEISAESSPTIKISSLTIETPKSPAVTESSPTLEKEKKKKKKEDKVDEAIAGEDGKKKKKKKADKSPVHDEKEDEGKKINTSIEEGIVPEVKIPIKEKEVALPKVEEKIVISNENEKGPSPPISPNSSIASNKPSDYMSNLTSQRGTPLTKGDAASSSSNSLTSTTTVRRKGNYIWNETHNMWFNTETQWYYNEEKKIYCKIPTGPFFFLDKDSTLKPLPLS